MTTSCEKRKASWKGYIIARKLIDNDEKEKPFTYYPAKSCGKPPYLYKTKKQATNVYNRMKKKDEFPANQSNTEVVKFKKEMYLDRY